VRSATFDANGNIISRVYEPAVPRPTPASTGYTSEGSRWRSTWVYDGLSRVRKRNDFTWYPGNPGDWYNGFPRMQSDR
jgi:hypothetical protein